MANTYRDIDKNELMDYALEYCDECISNVKTVTASYKLVDIPERHIPTIDYFLHHWLRRNKPEFHSKMIKPRQWYNASNDSNHPLMHTIKEITNIFHSLGKDIVANEGKGIFYAKNAFGMRDTPKEEIKTDNKVEFIITEKKAEDKDD